MTISSFREGYEPFSNFHMRWIKVGDILAPSNEHAFVALKTTDLALRDKILGIATPGEAKKFGRTIELRPGWDLMRKRVMLKLALAKFTQHPDLGRLLTSTGTELLVEGNHWHDNFWGDCQCAKCEVSPGYNYLGRILMAVRDVIRVD